MLVSKLFPSACSVPGAGTGWGITFSSPWESQESTLLPTLPEKRVSQAGTRHPSHPAPNQKQNPKQTMLHAGGCKCDTSQTQSLCPRGRKIPPSFPFLQW